MSELPRWLENLGCWQPTFSAAVVANKSQIFENNNLSSQQVEVWESSRYDPISICEKLETTEGTFYTVSGVTPPTNGGEMARGERWGAWERKLHREREAITISSNAKVVAVIADLLWNIFGALLSSPECRSSRVFSLGWRLHRFQLRQLSVQYTINKGVSSSGCNRENQRARSPNS